MVASFPLSRLAWLGAGLSIGFAFSFKQPALLYAAAFLSWLWWNEWKTKTRALAFARSVLFLTGLALPVVATALFFGSKGAFTPYWNWVFVMAVKQAGLPLNISYFIHDLVYQPALFLCLGAFLSRALGARGFLNWTCEIFRKPTGLFLLMGLVQLPPFLRMPGTNMLHYFGLTGFAFSLSACLLWCDVWPALKQWMRQPVMAALCLTPLIYVAGLAGISAQQIKDPGIFKDLKLREYLQRVVREHGAADQPLLVLSRFHAPRYYLLSGMKPWHPQMYFVFWALRTPTYTFEQAVSDSRSGSAPVILLHGDGPVTDPSDMNLTAHDWVRLDQNGLWSKDPLWIGFARRESMSVKDSSPDLSTP